MFLWTQSGREARCFIINYIIYALRMQEKMGNSVLKKNRETRSRSLGNYARASDDLDLRGLDYTDGEGNPLGCACGMRGPAPYENLTKCMARDRPSPYENLRIRAKSLILEILAILEILL